MEITTQITQIQNKLWSRFPSHWPISWDKLSQMCLSSQSVGKLL